MLRWPVSERGQALSGRAARSSSTPARVTELSATICVVPALCRKRLARSVLAASMSVLLMMPTRVRLNMRAKPGGKAEVGRVASCTKRMAAPYVGRVMGAQ